MTEPNTITDADWANNYYLVGINCSDPNNKTLHFVFPYDAMEIKEGMMEELLYHASSNEDKKNLKLTSKMKFSQGHLLASFCSEIKGMRICMLKSDTPKNNSEIEKVIKNMTDEEITECEMQLEPEKQ
jgi:hypothetical protein